MSTVEEIRFRRREAGLPHWKPSQRARLREVLTQGTPVAYWNSDAWGRPANGGTHCGERVRAGMMQEIDAPHVELCGPWALHATTRPHKWAGSRVWMVALHGKVVREGDKLGALTREILGEILPEEAIFCPSVAARLGRKDLSDANLSYANLSSANLSSANLRSARLSDANLSYANLSDADLSYANLSSANLSGANLNSAKLNGADLSYASLFRADLSGADLYGADMSCAYRGSSPAIAGWRCNSNGSLERA